MMFDYSGGLSDKERWRDRVFQRNREREIEIESVKRTLAVTLTRRFKHHRLYYHVYYVHRNGNSPGSKEYLYSN